jgi:heptosyltransferase-1
MTSPRLLIQVDTDNKYVWTQELANRPDMKEYIGESDEKGCHTYMAEIPKIDSNVVSFHLSATGLGDTVVGIYAACGLADAGNQVVYQARNTAWLNGISHPGVTIIPGGDLPFDANANYRDQLREAFHYRIDSRAAWYIKNISKAYRIAECKPSRPHVVKPAPVLDGGYVVLSPFTTHESRDWNYNHYRKLAVALQQRGIRVIPIGTAKQRERLDMAFYGLGLEKISDKPPEWVASLVANASVVVGNDSGIVHVGGLYGAPTVCLLAHFDPVYSFMCGDSIQWITPDMQCVRCHTLVEGGWDQNCNWVCSAIQTINPERVARKVIELYETTETKINR